MADSACYIELASNNGDFFTNSTTDDIMIRPQYATQDILIGTSNGMSTLTITSNSVGIGTSAPAYSLDVAGDINFTGAFRQNGTPYVGSQWSNNSSNVFLLGSNVGIGTSAPAYPLDVVGDINFTGAFRQNGTPYVGSQWSNNSANVFLLGSNVGIGTSSPASLFHVQGNSLLNGLANIRSNQNKASLTVYNPVPMPMSGSITYEDSFGINVHTSNSSVHWVIGQNVNDGLSLVKWDAPSNVWFPTTGFVMASNGFLGLGTNAPTANIHVNNDFHIAANSGTWNTTAGKGIFMRYSTTTGQDAAFIQSVTRSTDTLQNMFIQGSNIQIGSQGSGSATPSLYIRNTGNVGIGTTTPTAPLQITATSGDPDVNGVYVYNPSTNASSNAVVCVQTNGATSGNPYYSWDINGVAGWSMGISNADSDKLVIKNNWGFKGDSNIMTLTTDGNVGIATASPAYKLDVAGIIKGSDVIGTASGSANFTQLWNDGAIMSKTGNYLRFGTVDTIGTATNWSEKMRIHTDGNVGVGATLPSTKLDVNGTLTISGKNTWDASRMLINILNTDPCYFHVGAVQGAAHGTINYNWTRRDAGGPTGPEGGTYGRDVLDYGRSGLRFDNDGSFNVLTEGSNVTLNSNNHPPIRFTINSNGDVGIGTTSPAYTLDVNGSMRTQNVVGILTSTNHTVKIGDQGTSQNNVLQFGNVSAGSSNLSIISPVGVAGNWSSGTSVGDTVIRASTGSLHIATSTGGSTANIVLASGNVGIGTASPGFKLDVRGSVGITNAGTKKLQFDNDSSTNRHIVLYENTNNEHQFYGFGINNSILRYQVSASNANHVFYAATSSSASTELMRIQGTGNVGIGTASPAYKLDVNGTARINSSTAIYDGNGAGGGAILSLRNSATANDPRWIIRGPDWGNNAGLFIGYNECNDTSFGSWLNAGNAAMSIRAVGSYYTVGIGTSGNSSFALQVNGTYCQYGQTASFVYSNVNTLIGAGDVATRYNGLVKEGDSLIVGYSNAINTGGLVLGTWSAGMSGIRVDGPTGYVGVGSSNPAYKLDVVGDIITTWIRSRNNAGWYNETYGGGFYMTDTTWVRTYGTKNFFHDGSIMRTDGQLHVGNGGSTFLCSNGGDFAYRTNVLFANTAGNVGIGTSNPSYKLHVNGDINFTGALYSNGTAFVGGGGSSQWSNNSANVFLLGSNVGIGTTSPGYMLDVMNTTASNAVICVRSSTNGSGRLMLGNTNHGIARGANIGGATDGNDVTVYTAGGGSVTLATAGGEGLRVNSSANVGIGTTSPGYKLDVNGDIRVPNNSSLMSGTTTGFLRMLGTASATYIQSGLSNANASAAPMVFGNINNTVEWARFSDTGNFGLGTTSPSYKLDVSGSSRVGLNYTFNENFPFTSASTNRRYALLATVISNNGLIRIQGIAGGHDAALAGQGKCKFDITIDGRNQHIRGNVANFYGNNAAGIVVYRDNTTAAWTVYLTGQNWFRHNTQVFAADTSGVTVSTTLNWGTDTSWSTPSGTTLYLDTVTHIPASVIGTDFYLSTAGSPVYGITTTNSGNVGIGTSNPSYILDVSGTGRFTTGTIINNNQSLSFLDSGGTARSILSVDSGNVVRFNGASSAQIVYINPDNTGGATCINYNNSSVTKIYNGTTATLTVSGCNVGIATTSPTYTLHVVGNIYATGDIIGFSDIRLKSNITIIDSALSKIHKLKGYTFNLPDDEKKHTGLIAQEVLEVLPEAVHQEKKADGTDGYYSLAYGNMAGLFVEAIKEIDNKYKTQIEQLQQTVSTLKDEIEALKTKYNPNIA